MDFNSKLYISNYPDLKHLKTHKQAVYHYNRFGKKEGRVDYNLNIVNIIKTKFNNNNVYAHCMYASKKNKICFIFTPRSGCTVTIKCFLDLNNLLQDLESKKHMGKMYVHYYRHMILEKKIETINIDKLKNDNYNFIKFIVNPYLRAVSIFTFIKHNLSFKEFLKQINILKLSEYEKFHIHQQYISDEEKYINKYIKIDKIDEIYKINDFEINPNNYTSVHHSQRKNIITFCGDIPKNKLQLPQNYKYMYDDEIKKLVENLYKKDIEYYNYTFEELN